MTQGKQQSHLSGILRAVIFGCLAAAALLLPLLAAAFHWHSSIQALVPFVEHYHGGTRPLRPPLIYPAHARSTREMRPGQLKGNVGAGDELEGAIFIGHLATDLDSIVAAIAAAELHRFPHHNQPQNQPGCPPLAQRVAGGGATLRAAFHARQSTVEGGYSAMALADRRAAGARPPPRRPSTRRPRSRWSTGACQPPGISRRLQVPRRLLDARSGYVW